MNRLEHLITIAGEEAVEVAQRVSKALRFGLDEVQPGQPYSNIARLMHEYADLQAAIEMMLVAAGREVPAPDRARIDAKKAKVEAFLELSRRCGTLQDAGPAALPLSDHAAALSRWLGLPVIVDPLLAPDTVEIRRGR